MSRMRRLLWHPSRTSLLVLSLKIQHRLINRVQVPIKKKITQPASAGCCLHRSMTASSVTSPAARAVPDVLALYWPPFFLKRSLRNEPVNRHPGGPTWQHKETEMRCEWGKRKRQRRQTGGEDEQRRCEHCPPHPPTRWEGFIFPTGNNLSLSLSLIPH